MSTHAPDPRHQYSSTYFADRSNRDERDRLAVQDRLMTEGMGGVLPEQPDPSLFRRMLDVGCGTGDWLIEAAKTYPHMTQLIGVDVSNNMVEYARAQAEAAQVQDRVEFHVMDALLILEFPQGYFDLTNMRFATGFTRTWDWPKLLKEMQRVTRAGGAIRLTEVERVHVNNTAALRLLEAAGNAFYKAGHLFTEGKTDDSFSLGTIGVAGDLARLLRQYGVQNVQTHTSRLEFAAGTPAGQSITEDARLGSRTIIPFIQKWCGLPDDYEENYQQMLVAMQRPDYLVVWELLTAWGTSSHDKTRRFEN